MCPARSTMLLNVSRKRLLGRVTGHCQKVIQYPSGQEGMLSRLVDPAIKMRWHLEEIWTSMQPLLQACSILQSLQSGARPKCFSEFIILLCADGYHSGSRGGCTAGCWNAAGHLIAPSPSTGFIWWIRHFCSAPGSSISTTPQIGQI